MLCPVVMLSCYGHCPLWAVQESMSNVITTLTADVHQHCFTDATPVHTSQHWALMGTFIICRCPLDTPAVPGLNTMHTYDSTLPPCWSSEFAASLDLHCLWVHAVSVFMSTSVTFKQARLVLGHPTPWCCQPVWQNVGDHTWCSAGWRCSRGALPC